MSVDKCTQNWVSPKNWYWKVGRNKTQYANILENDRTIPSSRPIYSFIDPAPYQIEDVAWIGLRLGISQFFCRHYSCFKSRL